LAGKERTLRADSDDVDCRHYHHHLLHGVAPALPERESGGGDLRRVRARETIEGERQAPVVTYISITIIVV